MAKFADNVLQALDSWAADLDGQPIHIRVGDTIEADHPAVKRWPDKFGPIIPKFRTLRNRGIEQATAAPGEKRGE